ncbi:SDR family oxidoreductase [Hoyosella rhizosphaerae]|uniref:Short-chain dehydrogenase n=1 Tax=Hoyosella rhizosphaerae TaxID=1755582 RepID=A0A916UL76_9ACTN|nr:SDR family oxidoreductase [Hoyosella rhizosphaerae]MBN4925371.1 SDR family oxidoreductase [Hoyosella rhizosphaerae]GGC75753.1 short-chain dehydrogenase [Hoyosella rhizosphaerae]
MRTNILITGASSGLGEGMARQFAAKDRNLALCARRTERLEALASELRSTNPGITVVVKELDVNDHDSVFRVFHECRDELGSLDRVIANAGLGKGQPIGTGAFAANKQTMETNVIGLLAQCEAALEIFREQKQGHLVIVSSVSAVRGMRGNVTAYAASKSAAASLAEGIRMQHLGSHIKVTALLPGYIESEMTAQAPKTPLMTSADKGAKALVKAIEREPGKAYIPGWPWTVLAQVMRFAPLPIVRKLS